MFIKKWRWLRAFCKDFFSLYDISDLTVGGHCGCCRAWVPNAIVARGWEWTLCNERLTGK